MGTVSIPNEIPTIPKAVISGATEGISLGAGVDSATERARIATRKAMETKAPTSTLTEIANQDAISW